MSSGRGRDRIRRRLTFGTAGLAAALLLALAGPGAGTAHAAGQAKATALAGPCAGHKVRTIPFSTGRIEVFKTRGFVCAVTIAKRGGARKAMSVSVQARGSRPARDQGRYTRRAGPVVVHAGNRCVRVTGKVSGRGASSGWILC
ncbi:hypothetical protein [Streptomyces sp. WAC 01529]|uniref:hypothetical protein n=1 Tax=Streptomyces sp. WAC 01529 TaxID=2203205 RepID=UPI001F0C0B72|nr:hypothetical protein [Streptomyces sp. WAC 01529]